jgi:hypothetical protein
VQEWERCGSSGDCISGQNLIIKSTQIGATVAESIIINIPIDPWGNEQSNKGIGLAISFLTLISRQVLIDFDPRV